MDALIQERARRALAAIKPSRKLSMKQVAVQKETVAVLMMFCAVELNNLCIRYPLSVQVECAQILGQKIGGRTNRGNFLDDVRDAIKDATFGRAKLSGFERGAYTVKPVKAKKPAKNPRKRRDPDWTIYKDPESTSFVPPGFCVYLHGMGQCNKSAADCSHKHRKWTAAELAAAKKKALAAAAATF